MKSLLLLLFILLLPVAAEAQRQNNLWYFGTKAVIDFNSGTPVPSENGATATREGTAAYSDPRTGRLMFYTDGISVWNRLHRRMPNGDGLMGNISSTQSAMIVPMPGSRTTFYVFTTDGALLAPPALGLNYSIVDMTLDGGNGDVTIRNQPLLRPSIEGQAAYRVCDRDEYWLLSHGLGNNAYYAYRISASGIASPVISRVGEVRNESIRSAIGALAFSHDGSMIAAVDHSSRFVELLRFDQTTGVVSNPVPLSVTLTTLLNYGACFSPDNRRLYVSTLQSGIYQFDLSSGDSGTIARSIVQIGGYGGSLQLGPDGKIYNAEFSGVGVVQRPNEPGTAASYRSRVIEYRSARPDLSLPAIITGNSDLYLHAAGPNVEICPGDSVPLRASGGASYRWSPADGLSCTDCPAPIASPTRTTKYYVEISGLHGCPVVDSTLVILIAPPAVEAGAGESICSGDSIRLHGSGVGTLSWSPAAGLSCTTCPDPIASPTTTTVYRLTVTGARGCRAVDSVRVVVFDPSTVTAGADTSICSGESVGLQASEGSTWNWSPAEGLSCIDCRSPVARPDRTTRYSVTVTGDEGCSAESSVLVTVLPAPVAKIERADTAICEGGSVRLEATGGSRYLWTPADGLSCTGCADPVATPSVTTTYHVAVFNSSGCSSSDSITIAVRPVPPLGKSGDARICRGESVVLNISGALLYRWSPAEGLSCIDCAAPVASPLRTTIYHVVGTMENGCERGDSTTVIVRDGPALALSGDSAICAGGTARIVAEGAATYRWSSPGLTLDCPTCAEQKVTPAATTVLYLEGRSADGCVAIDSFTVVVTEKPAVSITPPGTICAGESMQLDASGATTYLWEPATGLSCSDCADPVASPSVTTRYRLIGRLAGGCADTVFTTVTVTTASASIAALPRDVRFTAGGRRTMMLTLDRPLVADTLLFTLGWRRGVVGLEEIGISSPLQADGWSLETISRSETGYSGKIARATAREIPAGGLLELSFEAYLGDSSRSELPFTLSTRSACVTIESRPGSVVIDSICGLDFRLIELASGKLRLDAPAPHPIVDRGMIRYELPFDADDAELTLIDAAGDARTLASGRIPAGEHEVLLDAGAMASGVYMVRLRVGELMREIPMGAFHNVAGFLSFGLSSIHLQKQYPSTERGRP